jgi:hypothetical protein
VIVKEAWRQKEQTAGRKWVTGFQKRNKIQFD